MIPASSMIESGSVLVTSNKLQAQLDVKPQKPHANTFIEKGPSEERQSIVASAQQSQSNFQIKPVQQKSTVQLS